MKECKETLVSFATPALHQAGPLNQGNRTVQAIRIPPEHWGKVWRTLVASGPISCIGPERNYLVSDQQVCLLRRKKLPFEIVAPPDGRQAGRNHA